jgi:hypothetical protein
VRIEDGEPVITRAAPMPPPAGLPALETLLAARVEPVGLLDALAATEHWLHWTRFFGPISGFDAKIGDPVARYLATVFCYGTNIGPVQLARSLEGIEFRQLLWINQRHISEETLDRAIARVVEAYRRFTLPKCWGSATRVSADGTQWELYENNLLGERHIRYGSYGGIGYYHVAGDYIALFSRFIPCGVLEGYGPLAAEQCLATLRYVLWPEKSRIVAGYRLDADTVAAVVASGSPELITHAIGTATSTRSRGHSATPALTGASGVGRHRRNAHRDTVAPSQWMRPMMECHYVSSEVTLPVSSPIFRAIGHEEPGYHYRIPALWPKAVPGAGHPSP